MKGLGQRFAAIAFIACLEAMAWGCGSRSSVGLPGSPQPTEKPEIPSPAAPKPAPPPPLPPAAIPPGETAPFECALLDGPGESVETVALGDSVDPAKAPHPSNESERLVFRQLYETLIRVDCGGRVRPALAESWRLDPDGRTWIVTLREHARFSDGTPVLTSDVRASWTGGGSAEPRPPASRLVESIVPVDDRRLAITLRSRTASAPLALAHPDVAIAKHTADSTWPLGTRTDGIAPERAAAVAMAGSSITVTRDGLSSIRFLAAPGDPRDVLDRGVDLLVTRDPAALDYAATLPQFQSVPLDWHRIHVLLTPGRPRAFPSPPEHARQVLADDAVRGEARGATGPFWWQMLPACGVDFSERQHQSTPTPRIVYDARDTVARDLAERLVGLARSSSPAAIELLDALVPDRQRRPFERAVGLTGQPLARALRLGTEAHYILGLDRRSLDPCRDLQVLIESARWLDPETIVPLVDTRLRAIVRRGRAGVRVEWDGGLLIAGRAARDTP